MIVTVEDAARLLKVHPATLRRWIQAGCPVESLGEVGRGKGSLVKIESINRWRAEKFGISEARRGQAEILTIISTALADTIRRDHAHERLAISHGLAAGLLSLAFQRIWQNLTRRPLHEFVPPEEIAQLCAIWVQWRESNHGGK